MVREHYNFYDEVLKIYMNTKCCKKCEPVESRYCEQPNCSCHTPTEEKKLNYNLSDYCEVHLRDMNDKRSKGAVVYLDEYDCSKCFKPTEEKRCKLGHKDCRGEYFHNHTLDYSPSNDTDWKQREREDFHSWCMKNPAKNEIELAIKLASSADYWIERMKLREFALRESILKEVQEKFIPQKSYKDYGIHKISITLDDHKRNFAKEIIEIISRSSITSTNNEK